MAKKTNLKFIEAIDTGKVDWGVIRANFNNLGQIVDEHADELRGLASKQTQTISFGVDTVGLTTILNSNKHIRIKITNAFVQLGDSVPSEESIKLVGITDSLKFSSTEKAGKVKVFNVLKTNLMFTEPIIVETNNDRRIIVNVTYESTEVGN